MTLSREDAARATARVRLSSAFKERTRVARAPTLDLISLPKVSLEASKNILHCIVLVPCACTANLRLDCFAGVRIAEPATPRPEAVRAVRPRVQCQSNQSQRAGASADCKQSLGSSAAGVNYPLVPVVPCAAAL